MSSPPVLAINHLTVTLPPGADRGLAVNNVSLVIEPGRTLCVIGESGSGKSMIARAIMGLLPETVAVTGGEITLNGINLLNKSRDDMRALRGRNMSMVFQEPMTSLNPLMRIGQQIEEVFVSHGVDAGAAEIDDLLAAVGLPNPKVIRKAYPFRLSGGQRQRVMIAMALALKPSLLIADEPTTALDVTTQAQILKLMSDIQLRTGTAILFITHDFGVVADIADEVAVMEHGCVVEQGLAEDVLLRPSHPYTQKLRNAIPELAPAPRRALETNTVALRLSGLSKSYSVKSGIFGSIRKMPAVKDVSLEIKRGETLGLVGESGSGKSTVGRLIVRLLQPDSGHIVVGDVEQDLRRAVRRRDRHHIQMVFQDPYASLNPRRPVGRIIMDGTIAHGLPPKEARARLNELLAMVKLDPAVADRLPHEFSGGQRQRIGIARALALRPEVLVADEPVSALDVSIQAQVLDLLRSIRDQTSLAMLFITHDLRVAAQICDRIAVIYQGEIVECGETAAIFAKPQSSYTQNLLASVPGLGFDRHHQR